MTKVKMAKSQEQTSSMEFIGKRRAALERFLNRTAAHPLLYKDSDFREFLEKDDVRLEMTYRAVPYRAVII